MECPVHAGPNAIHVQPSAVLTPPTITIITTAWNKP